MAGVRSTVDVEPRGEGVDHGGADAVQATRGGVRPAAELAARVQLGEDHLDAGEPGLGLLVDRDATAVVVHLGRAVGVQDHLDARAVTAQRLVDRVVDDLPEAVHQPAGVGGADVHARALADRLEALEDEQVLGVVGVVDDDDLGNGAGTARRAVSFSRIYRPRRTSHPRRATASNTTRGVSVTPRTVGRVC